MESRHTAQSPVSRRSFMEKLPFEILHMIFAHLRFQDVTNMRRLCKNFAAAGLHRLFRSYHLIFKKSSFEKLLEVSQHSVFSKDVQLLYYEGDLLTEYAAMAEWREHASYNYLPSKKWSEGKIEAGVWEWPGEYIPPAESELQLHHAYAMYKECLEDQRTMQKQNYNAQIISDAMRGLTNLKSLYMSMEWGLGIRSDYADRAFSQTLQKPWGDAAHRDRCGVSQLYYLLLGVYDNGLKIENLRCGRIHWSFFTLHPENFAKFRKACQHLKTLELHIGSDFVNKLECNRYLSRGGLREFITGAPELSQLNIKLFNTDFNVGPWLMPAHLVDIVGSFKWNSLRVAHFDYVAFNAQDAIDFYKRHSETIRDIGISNVKLEEGEWATFFQEMASILQLDEVSIRGTLSDPVAQFSFGDNKPYVLDGLPIINVFVEHYLLESRGEGELLDLDLLMQATLKSRHPESSDDESAVEYADADQDNAEDSSSSSDETKDHELSQDSESSTAEVLQSS
ncbi:MAG: hypothetical protein Q9191_007407 [Dirinaria sp. TL-2023a]